jgi:signal transduction histidine kinase/CheY-like chemotaxis protein
MYNLFKAPTRMTLFKLHTPIRSVLFIALLWSALIFLSLYSGIRSHEEHSILLATNQASDYWNKDSAFRAWATRHGGLYVKPDERTPPDPLLPHLPHRDVETKDGVKLTLMNPAYMMRQMTEEFEELYGIKGKITGQVLLDPEGQRNRADSWELESLKQFDQGKSEIIQLTQINDEPYLRLMRPLIMTDGCVVCHGHLGFKVGDIRGGVSVSVPLVPFNIANESSKKQAIISHIVIWLMGIMGIIAIFYIESIKKNQIEKDKLARELINRSQKMDALGKLTGGIAHDYNNMLGVVLGYADLLEDALSEHSALALYVHEIKHAGKRGVKLTKKLLAFSRKKHSTADILNINTLLRNEKHLLEKTLTVRIKLVFELADGLWTVWLDSGDLEDAILNMSINAMHAIAGNGQLTLQTCNESINVADAKLLNLEPGDYVLLKIIDTGCGMNESTIGKIFDPFFSTKGEKGTGLGLSQVFGFVERSKGAIKVYSELNHGSQFMLYFPRYQEQSSNGGEQQTENNNNIANINGSETILLVDDEPALLKLTAKILSKHGYNVICAGNTRQVLDILEHESIDLLLSDVIMPEMDGYELAAIVQQKYPRVKIQLVSGFSDDRHVKMIDDDLHQHLISKPFNSQNLLQRIRVLLGE